MSAITDLERLPPKYPTHKHDGKFWEALGRAVATFGFLEEILARAIFALTAVQPAPEINRHAAVVRWQSLLEKAVSDPLGPLIDSYAKALSFHYGDEGHPFDGLVDDLGEAAKVRNVICHGSWNTPDAHGYSLPHYVNKRLQIIETPMDEATLGQLQRHGAELACAVMSSVTHLGWQFPGSDSPGAPI